MEGHSALELERCQPHRDLIEARAVLVERRERLVCLGEHCRNLLKHVLGALGEQRYDLAPLRDRDHERARLLRNPLGRAVAGPGLAREDRRVRCELHVRPQDLGCVVGERDRAIHLRELVEDRRRVLDVELHPAGQQWRQLVLVADDDQRARVGLDDVVDALPQGGSRRDHLERPEKSGLLSRLKLSKLFSNSRHRSHDRKDRR